MNDAFQDREKGFEQKYALEQTQKFRIKAHRDRLFGLWVASQMGKNNSSAQTYASELVALDLEPAGDTGMLDKVRRDLKAQNIFIEDHVLFMQLRKAEEDSTRDMVGSDP